MPLDDRPYGGLVLFGAPSRRQRLARRRAATILAIVAFAVASWVIGALSAPPAPAQAAGGAISYFPSE